jgi:hypothetical protein
MIDWEGCRKRWNIDHKTTYETDKEWLTKVYKDIDSVVKMSRLIFVSHTALYKKMRLEDVEIGEKGHKFPSPTAKRIMKVDTSKMTAKEISERFGITMEYTYSIMRRLGQEFDKRVVRTKNRFK